MRRFVYVFALSLALLLWATIPIHAQTTNGSIEGAVTDQSGGAISGASVTARNMDTGLTQTTTTTQAGIYSLQNIPPGRYSVTVEAPNLKKYTREGVTVSTGTAVSLDIPMQVGAVSESITVSADASQLQTTTSEIGATVESKLVANLPLQVSGTIRNPVQFIELVPGFVGSVANDPGSNSSDDFKLNGGQEGGTDILVDGVSISLVSPNTQQNKGVSPEAVEEFKTLQSNFSAEYGQSGDSIVSLTVKSGTNHLHGDFYEFQRNSALDANSWVNNTAGAKRSEDLQSDFGALISGPVVLPKIYNGRDKTFFMFDYEGFRFHTGGSSVASFPNSDYLQGNFSALCAAPLSFNSAGLCSNGGVVNSTTLAYQLYDPTTHVAIPNDTLTGDPNYSESKVMSKAFGYVPPTNGNLTNNVFVSSKSAVPANIFDIKIDQNISSKQRISFGFDFDNTNNESSES